MHEYINGVVLLNVCIGYEEGTYINISMKKTKKKCVQNVINCIVLYELNILPFLVCFLDRSMHIYRFIFKKYVPRFPVMINYVTFTYILR